MWEGGREGGREGGGQRGCEMSKKDRVRRWLLFLECVCVFTHSYNRRRLHQSLSLHSSKTNLKRMLHLNFFF